MTQSASGTEGTWGWYEIAPLQQFRYMLAICSTGSNSILDAMYIPLEIFKRCNNTSTTLALTGRYDVDIYLCYSSNTKIGIYCSNKQYRCEVYGVY